MDELHWRSIVEERYVLDGTLVGLSRGGWGKWGHQGEEIVKTTLTLNEI